jgi:hypothetical protein
MPVQHTIRATDQTKLAEWAFVATKESATSQSKCVLTFDGHSIAERPDAEPGKGLLESFE